MIENQKVITASAITGILVWLLLRRQAGSVDVQLDLQSQYENTIGVRVRDEDTDTALLDSFVNNVNSQSVNLNRNGKYSITLIPVG